jgi:hypothetical protein
MPERSEPRRAPCPQPGRDAAPERNAPDRSASARDGDRLRRRAIFLRELAEARQLRERVTPYRSRTARIRAALWMHSFRD